MKTGQAWPRQPFIGLALAAFAGILFADWVPSVRIPLVAVTALGLAALLLRRSLLVYLFAAAAFSFVHQTRQANSPGVQLVRELGAARRAVTAHGVVVSAPQISAREVSSFHLRLESLEFDGRTWPTRATILARWRGDVRYGDELRLFGVLQPVDGPRNPGEFDMRAYLARRDVRRALIVRYPENGRIVARDRGNPILAAAHRSRKWMQATLARGLEDSPEIHGVISGMVLGAREDTPDEVQEQFQQTGAVHLFAVSGLHVGIVAQLLWIIATAVRLPRKWAAALIIPLLFFYAAITGMNPSSIRAAIMAAIILGGFLIERKVLTGNSVAAAAVILLAWDTNQLFMTGFQLSFAVVTAIVILAQPLFTRMVRWGEPDAFLPKALYSRAQRAGQSIWRALAGGASVSLAAWVGSLPLILPYFYIVTPVSLFANLVVVPLAFFVLAIGLLALLATPLGLGLTVIFNNANWAVASAILGAVGLFARAPAGHLYLGQPHWPSGALVEINALDLGAGGSVHVRDRRRDWLIDCGGERDFRRVVRGYLRSRGINRLDGLVLTHGDAGHIGAGAKLLRVFRPREIFDTAAPDRSPVHRQLIAQLGAARRIWAAPEKLSLGRDVVAQVLFPPPGFKADTADDQALVLQLTVAQKWRVLLMSDSGEATERALLKSGADLRSDILIKGQHHSGVSGSAALLDAVRPQAIIATGLDFPENERIKDEWAEAVNARGIQLFRQDQTGAVMLRFFRQHWEARAYLGPPSLRSANR